MIAIVVAVLVARVVSQQMVARLSLLNAEPIDGRLLRYRKLLYSCRDLLKPTLIFVALAGAVAVLGRQAGRH